MSGEALNLNPKQSHRGVRLNQRLKGGCPKLSSPFQPREPNTKQSFPTQGAQYPLIKEYSLNHIRDLILPQHPIIPTVRFLFSFNPNIALT